MPETHAKEICMQSALSIRTYILAVALGSISWTAGAQTVSDSNLVITPLLQGLSQPTGMSFTGVNEGFVIEKASGQVKRFSGGVVTSALDLGVQSDSERGLLGIALDPAFASNGFTYLYYSSNNLSGGTDGGNWVDNRVAKYQWNGTNLVATGSFRTFGTSADSQTNGANHDGGPLLFGADGKLYGATGDLNRNRTEQNTASTGNLSSNVGGVYRLNSDLTVPTDNPFTGGQSPFYAYGVRNSFGMAVDPVNGNLWNTENGPTQYDEINLVASGFNSGWSKIMGPDSRDAQNVSDLVSLPGSAYSDPEFSFLTPVGITALQFLQGSSWGPAYDDAVIVGDNNTGRIYLLRLNAARTDFVLAGNLADLVADTGAEQESLVFGRGFSVATDMRVGPDVALYVTSLGDGAIYRIAPVPEPSTWAALGVGLLLLGIRMRRRR